MPTRICLAALILAACGHNQPSPVGDQPPPHCCCSHVDRDDEAPAPPAEPRQQKVLLVTQGNLYLEGAMLVHEHIEVFKLTPAEYAADPQRAHADVHVVVFDDYTPQEVPPAPLHAIYFHPDPAGSPIPVSGTVERPWITEIAEDHPVMRWVTVSDVSIDASRVFAPRREEGEEALATRVRDVVIAARRDSGRKIVEVGFSLGASDLALRTAFPILLFNTFDWFGSDDAEGQRFEQLPVDECEGDAGGVCVAMASCQR